MEALNERGTLHRVSGELTRAEECHQQALELARAIASSWDEAHAQAGLGRCDVTGDLPSRTSVRVLMPTGMLAWHSVQRRS